MPIKKKRVTFVKTNKKEKSTFIFLKKYFKEQEEKVRANPRRQFAFFILGFLVAYLLLTFFISIIPETAIKGIVGSTTQGILSIQGISATSIGVNDCQEISWLGDTVSGQCYSFYINQYPVVDAPNLQGKIIVISWLCTGVLEIIVLVSAIIASFGVSWKRKAVGVGVAIILGIIFNLLRIVITINLILTQNVQTVELAHDLLFRLILFFYIVIVYVAWFYWAAKEK
ncbi:MAG: exosortase/archaeosortase family protein [archaeon]